MGSSAGILAIIEITPDHFLIGLIIDYDIAGLIKIRIPVESFFSFVDSSDWHFYLGTRQDPVSVSVLDIIKATGYLMIKGNGLPALPAKHLPEITGFAIGAGAAASFTWGDTDIGLYLRIAGSFDAVIGFDPFILAGEFELSGELRLFIISIDASAELDILVVGHTGSFSTHIHGEACGHVDFFFFSIEGCVSITIGPDNAKPDLFNLVQKLSIKSRSPALLVGTGVDKPIDTSLGEGLQQDGQPGWRRVQPSTDRADRQHPGARRGIAADRRRAEIRRRRRDRHNRPSAGDLRPARLGELFLHADLRHLGAL